MESAIDLYKTELIKPQRPWKTFAQVKLATAEWVDWYTTADSTVGSPYPTRRV